MWSYLTHIHLTLKLNNFTTRRGSAGKNSKFYISLSVFHKKSSQKTKISFLAFRLNTRQVLLFVFFTPDELSNCIVLLLLRSIKYRIERPRTYALLHHQKIKMLPSRGYNLLAAVAAAVFVCSTIQGHVRSDDAMLDSRSLFLFS